MSLDLRHMLKVYNYVNDDKRPKVNLKFLGIIGVVLGAALGVSFLMLMDSQAGRSPSQVASSTKTDYVGLSPGEVDQGLPTALADTRLDAWYASHPDAHDVKVEPVKDGDVTVGYNVSYTE